MYKPGKEGAPPTWTGRSSHLAEPSPGFAPHNPGATFHAKNLSEVAGGAASVPGLKHVSTVHVPNAGAGGKEAYMHTFSAKNPELAARQLTQGLGVKTAVTPLGSHPLAAGGAAQTLGAETGSGLHHITIVPTPARPSLPAAAAGRARSAGQGVAGGLRGAAGAVKQTLGAAVAKVRAAPVSKMVQPTEDAAHTAPFHAAAAKLGAVHYTTQVARAKKNFEGQPTDRKYSHFYTHKNPMASARRMKSALEEAGHGVSGVAQTRVSHGGEIRHQYRMNVAPAGGGPSHTVNFFRP